MSQGRRHFTDEFKREAVALLGSSGRPLSRIASELGISPSNAAQLAQWKRRAGGGVGAAPDTGVGPALRPGLGSGDFPASSRERSAADGARHFKKGCGHLLGTAEMRFRLIEDHRDIWPVRVMCEALNVSPSGYYAWRSRPDSLRKIANRALLVDIQRVHAQHRERYGAPRIHAELRAEGQTVSRKRVERVMRQHGIRARRPHRYRSPEPPLLISSCHHRATW
jgi:transposase-like protein